MTQTNLRQVKSLTLPAGAPRATTFGKLPEVKWIPPTELLIDDTYQRDLNRRSMVLISKVVAGFAWRKTKPPVVVQIGKMFHVIDGQHTAIAAATLGIPKILVFVVDAPTDLDRADSFVAHNQDRLSMTPFDIYRAKLGAGEPAAVAVNATLKEAGVRLIRVLNKIIMPKVGDTAAIGLVRALVARRGKDDAVKLLKAMVDAGRAPITAAEITAADAVLFDPKNPITPEALTEAARAMGDQGVLKCLTRAMTERVPVKVMLADEYRRLARKKKVS